MLSKCINNANKKLVHRVFINLFIKIILSYAFYEDLLKNIFVKKARNLNQPNLTRKCRVMSL